MIERVCDACEAEGQREAKGSGCGIAMVSNPFPGGDSP